MKIGLVTVLFKSDDVLPEFIQSIQSQTYKNTRLYLVDNSPAESTRKLITELQLRFPGIDMQHIESSSNIGVAAGNNVGIKTAFNDGCEDIIVLNNDIVFEKQTMFASLHQMAQKQEYDMIVPKIYYYGTNKLWFAGGKFKEWQCKVVHVGELQEDDGSYDKSAFITYAPTCFVYIKKRVFDNIGLMDEKYFVYVDDTDFMFRALRAGNTLRYEPKLTVQHKVSTTTGGRLSDFSLFYNSRNRVYFSRKFFNFPKREIAICYTIASLVYFALKERRKTAVNNVIKGLKHGLSVRGLVII